MITSDNAKVVATWVPLLEAMERDGTIVEREYSDRKRDDGTPFIAIERWKGDFGAVFDETIIPLIVAGKRHLRIWSSDPTQAPKLVHATAAARLSYDLSGNCLRGPDNFIGYDPEVSEVTEESSPLAQAEAVPLKEAKKKQKPGPKPIPDDQLNLVMYSLLFRKLKEKEGMFRSAGQLWDELTVESDELAKAGLIERKFERWKAREFCEAQWAWLNTASSTGKSPSDVSEE